MLWSYAPPAVSACKQIASAFISVYELVGAAKLVVVVPMPPRLVPGCCKWYLTLVISGPGCTHAVGQRTLASACGSCGRVKLR